MSFEILEGSFCNSEVHVGETGEELQEDGNHIWEVRSYTTNSVNHRSDY